MLTSINWVEKGDLIATLVFVEIFIIPPLRFVGSIGLRTIAFLSSGNLCKETWGNLSTIEKAQRCCKVALVILGIVGVILSSPLLCIGSLAFDVVLQVKECILALKEKKWDKALIHFFMIIIISFL